MNDFLKENKLLLIITIIFVCSLITGYCINNILLEKNSNKNLIENNKVEEKEAENKIVNYLILGVDERTEDVGRSDTIIVLSVNMSTKKIGLISIPRDSRVNILGHGDEKINHTYAYGGVKLTQQTVENLLGIKINNYIVFNFKSFTNVIDILGGVDLSVEKDMFYRDDYDGENGLIIDLKEGNQHLDGNKAIQYVRYRDEEGDIGRVKRQQNFLNAIVSKVTNPNIILKLPSITNEVIKSIKTDIPFDSFINIVSLLKENDKYEIKPLLLKGYPEMINELSYWIVNKEQVQKDLIELNDFIFNKKELSNKEDNNNQINNIFNNNEDINTLELEIKKIDEETQEKRINEMRKVLLEKELKEKEFQKPKEMFNDKRKTNLDGLYIINTNPNTDILDNILRELEEQDIEINKIEQKINKDNTSKTIFIINNKNKKMINQMKNISFKYSIIYKPDINSNNILIIGNEKNE